MASATAKLRKASLNPTQRMVKKAIPSKTMRRLRETLLARWSEVLRSGDVWNYTEHSIMEAISKKRLSDDPKKVVCYHLDQLIRDFADKIHTGQSLPDEVTIHECGLELHPPSMCSVEIEDKEYQITVGGTVQVVGKATVRFGTRTVERTVFVRFIGKTFWQYCGCDHRG